MKNEQLIVRSVALEGSVQDVFAAHSHHDYAILLESASATHPNSRYSIIALNPVHTVEVKNGATYIDGNAVDTCPFVAIDDYIAALPCKNNSTDLPFIGGAMGLFGYDLGRILERLPSLASNDINLPDLAVGIYHHALIHDANTHSWTFVCQPVEGIADVDTLLALYLSKVTSSHIAPFSLTSSWQANMTKAQYQVKFAQIQNYLQSGDCYQINLAQRFSATFEGDPWQAYCLLSNANQAPFSSYINHSLGQVLSISPERFIQVKDRQVETKPIKGTLPRGKTPIEDAQNAKTLQASPKDRAENVMIVDLLRNDLGKVAAPGSVHVPALFAIESFPAVHHLVSTVTATLADGVTPLMQLKAAFPGGSITGAPKIRAMEIIEELEPHRRNIYCGSIGYISACGTMDTSITIRTLVSQENTLYCYAGGGIVADSNPDSEYQETYDKVNKILPVLGHATN